MSLTTHEVVENILIPECREHGVLRYYEVIAKKYGRKHVGGVTVFVSHAWSNMFGLIVMMLTNSFHHQRCEDLPVYFWIDIFGVAQTQHVVSDAGDVICNDLDAYRIGNKDDMENFEDPL
jgi:hypothetical protein